MRTSTTIAILLTAATVACGGDSRSPVSVVPRSVASCGANHELFTTIPLPVSDIMGWVPLGNLNPPAHTFPTDHQYIYLQSYAISGGVVQPLVAPGKMTLVGAKRASYSTGTVGADYAVSFAPCAEVLGEFQHVTSLEPDILAKLGPFDQGCQTYSPNPGLQVTACYTKPVDIPVEAGQRIGGARGLDLFLYDKRIQPLSFANPSRWVTNQNGFDRFHTVAFTDYIAEPARSEALALLGSFDGKRKRTAAPLGGTIATDVASTAQGGWFLPGNGTYPETPHLAIVPDNVDPTRITFSTGGMLPGLPAGAYLFSPVGAGTENRDPATIAPGPTLYCWEIGYTPSDRRGTILVQLTDATTLRVEARPTALSCAESAPYTFGTNATTYIR